MNQVRQRPRHLLSPPHPSTEREPSREIIADPQSDLVKSADWIYGILLCHIRLWLVTDADSVRAENQVLFETLSWTYPFL